MSRARSVSQLVGANTALGNTVITGTANVSGAVTFSNTLSVASNTLLGTTTTTNNLRLNQKLAVVTTGSGIYGGASLTSYPGTVNVSSIIDLQRSRGTTDGSMTAVASGDILGYGPVFRGADGTNFVDAAYIQGAVDGTVSTGVVPGRLTFNTSNTSGSNQEVMRMDSAGRVTLPYQPGFRAYATTAQSPTSGSTIIFNSTSSVTMFNTGSHYNTSTGIFTAPVAGIYAFQGQVLWQNVGDGTQVDLSLALNGSIKLNTNRRKYSNNITGHGNYIEAQFSLIWKLAANDTVQVLNGSPGTLMVYVGDQNWTWFSGYLLG